MNDLMDFRMAGKGNARGSGYERNEHDYYVEPRWSVDALLDVENFHRTVHDPACGGGNIPEACKARHIPATGSDIVDRGYGPVADFLRSSEQHDNIISNPPFKIATEFTLHALGLVRNGGKVAILQQLTWLEGKARGEALFDRGHLARVWVFRRRVSMPPGGSAIQATGGSKAFAWFVFAPNHSGRSELGWLV